MPLNFDGKSVNLPKLDNEAEKVQLFDTETTNKNSNVEPNAVENDGANTLSSHALRTNDGRSMRREPGPKLMKLSRLLRCFNLRVVFRVLGTAIGTYPMAFLIASLIIASLSLGMVKLKLRNRVRDGYTPSTSLSRYEIDVLKEFFGSSGDPSMTTVLVRARDGGSMHRTRHLKEAVHLHSLFRRNISAPFLRDEDDADTVSPQLVYYQDICGPFCDANVIIDYFYEALDGLLKSVRAGKKLYPSTNLTYPIAKVNGFELHLERNFFGVSVGPANASSDSKSNRRTNYVESEEDLRDLAELSKVTSINFVEALMMIFRGDISHADDEEKMSLWEMSVYKYSRDVLNSSLLEILIIGNEIVDYEMNRDAQRTAPYFAMGFLFMFSFCFLALLLSSSFYGILDWAKFTLAMCISLCPTLSITTTFGVCAIIGLRTNSVMLIMPFLICGIGVNDAFLICHAWLRLARRRLSVANRLGLVLEEVGPSITITTLTNVITFGIGAFTPTPEISLFCLATAIALGFAYIFTLLLFTSFLYFATIVEQNALSRRRTRRPLSPQPIASITSTSNTPADLLQDEEDECCSGLQKRLRYICKRFGDIYCKILLSPIFVGMLIFATLVYWYFAILGTCNINAKLDTEKILPRDCPILEPHRVISHLVWTEYYPVTVLVNNPVDIRSKTQLERFNSMVDEFEALNMCKGKEFTVLWLRDYAAYCRMVNDYGFDYFSDDNDVPSSNASTELKAGLKDESGLDYSHFRQFLSSPFYKHFTPFLQLSNTSGVPISRFWFMVTFYNTTDWQSRIDLMQEWRRVAQNYPDMNVTVWEVNGMFVDQMLSLKTLTLQTTVLTLACMTVVCAVFIQNPLSVATAVIAIGSISVGVIGYLSWWHLNLDPVTLCAVLMSIGMSVDFTAHICYHFQLTKRQKIHGGTIIEVPLKTSAMKLRNTINSVAWPMSEAGFSTAICVLPLIFLQDYIPLVFVKTVLLVVIWGMFHGLVLMPALLASLPPSWLELNCYRILFQKIGSAQSAENHKVPVENIDENFHSHLLTNIVGSNSQRKSDEFTSELQSE